MNNDDVILNWIKKAENDLKNAEIVIKTEDPPLDTICFHAQQCSEKYLKALLIYYGKEPQKTHNIAELINSLENKVSKLNDFIDEADNLTDYAVGLRYPEEIFEISKNDAIEAINITRKIKEIVLSNLPDSFKQKI